MLGETFFNLMDEEDLTWETVEVFCALRTLFACRLSVSAARRGSLRPPWLSCQVKGNLGFYFESHGLNLTRKKKLYFLFWEISNIHRCKKRIQPCKIIDYLASCALYPLGPFPSVLPMKQISDNTPFYSSLGEGRKQLTNTKTVSRKTPEMTQIGSH